jgi:molecular chaperone Hsp33
VGTIVSSDSASAKVTTSRWVKCISTHGNVRGVAIQATDLVRETAARHQLKGAGAQGLGEALISALLLSSCCKDGERVNLNIQTEGAFRQALVEAKPDGSVRGYLIERDPSSFEENKAAGPWSSGTLSVLRTRDREGEQPYIGTVALVTGHLAKDMTFYFAQSEQIPSAVGLAVNLRGDEVSAAGGFLVQAMPGAGQREIAVIEEHIKEIRSLSELLEDDQDPLKLLAHIFQSTAFVLLEEKPLRFHCNCSWERVYRALALIGAKELDSMLAEDEHATVRCDFCSKEFKVERSDLERLISGSKGRYDEGEDDNGDPAGTA